MTDFLDGETLREQYNAKKQDQWRRRQEKIPNWTPRRVGLDPQSVKDGHRRYRERHPERCKAAHERWLIGNPDAVGRMKSQIKTWRENHRDYSAISTREWAKKYPERVIRNGANRRARERAVGGKLSRDIITQLMKSQRGKCVACGMRLTRRNRHLDHIVPIKRGGLNSDSNVQLLCAPCNLSKHARDPIEFMQSKGFLL